MSRQNFPCKKTCYSYDTCPAEKNIPHDKKKENSSEIKVCGKNSQIEVVRSQTSGLQSKGSRQPSSSCIEERCIRIKLDSTYDLDDWDTFEVQQRDSYKEAVCNNSNHLSIDGFLNRNFFLDGLSWVLQLHTCYVLILKMYDLKGGPLRATWTKTGGIL
ncbi:hypothetical protein TNCT_77141 [Trichonephila clavata]|uniref:Uncharacterized protein n=1 Tax=Trichonephila clavata TaxID=2740835 RepID=A0A8X6LQ43_TRICU|nr:hypothetical protein TNCT_77141 [Trichonephila clavata]